jgi:gluconokinase
VYLSGSPHLLAERLQQRVHAFMSPSLLDSQHKTLEPPTADEAPLTVDIADSPTTITQRVRETFRLKDIS